jgi:hypothetical protein
MNAKGWAPANSRTLDSPCALGQLSDRFSRIHRHGGLIELIIQLATIIAAHTRTGPGHMPGCIQEKGLLAVIVGHIITGRAAFLYRFSPSEIKDNLARAAEVKE